jgi:CubicO group peptidase (beta-lactamase class C family)
MMGCMLPRRHVLTILLAALSFVSKAAGAQLQQFHTQLETVLKQHRVVGGGFAFIHGSGPATEYFFGEARSNTHQRVDADTAYNWASITKTMTAIAILQLRDRGKLSLDDAAVRYMPELREVHDEFGPVEEITIRHLLTHSAGFRNPTWPWDCDNAKSCEWQPFEPTKWTQVSAMLPYTDVGFKPGSRWSYSNLGYVFLGQIIERLSGDDFEVYIDKNILKPLGMTESYFDRSPYFLENHVSASYLRTGDKLTPQPFDFDTGITTSNSGLKSTIRDMEKYARFLIGDAANAVYGVVLKRSSLEGAWKGVLPATQPGEAPTAYTSGPGGAQPKMGLGFFEMEADGRRYAYHDGDQGGFSSELLIDPAGKSASILVVNTTDTARPAQDASHAESNTEPDPHTDLRQALRAVLMEKVFPTYAEK